MRFDHVLGVVAEMMRWQHPAQEHAGQRTAEHAREHEQADLEAGHVHLPIWMPIVRRRRPVSVPLPSLLERQDLLFLEVLRQRQQDTR